MYKLPLSILTAFCCSMPVAHADDEEGIIDLTPIVRDFVAGGAKEIAVPYFRYNDKAPVDGFEESITVYFNVYTVGTSSKLYSSLPRTVPMPTPACTTPAVGSTVSDIKVKFLGADSTSRVHFVLTGWIQCFDTADNQVKDSYKTLLYSTDASTAANSWIKVWNLNTDGANSVDVTGDGLNEIMLTMSVPTPTGAANAKVVYVQGSNGTIVHDNSYPISNAY